MNRGAVAVKRQDIIDKAVEKIKASFDDYEKSLKLANKYNLPKIYKILGSDVVHGAASNYDKKITIKDAYTPQTIATRTLQRMAYGAAIGAGYTYLTQDNPDTSTVLDNTKTSVAVNALLGATVMPAAMYGIGKGLEHLRQKGILKVKGSKK